MPSCFKLVKLCQCLLGAKWWTACSSSRDEIRALASMHIVTRPTSRKPSRGRYRSWDWSGSSTAARSSDSGHARSWPREMRWKVGNSKDEESHDWQRSSWHLCTLMSWPRSPFPARVTRRLPSLSSRSTSSAGGSGRSGRPSSPSLNCWCILETASINQGTDDRKTRGKKHTAFRNALHSAQGQWGASSACASTQSSARSVLMKQQYALLASSQWLSRLKLSSNSSVASQCASWSCGIYCGCLYEWFFVKVFCPWDDKSSDKWVQIKWDITCPNTCVNLYMPA